MRRFKRHTKLEIELTDIVQESEWRLQILATTRPDADVKAMGYYLGKDKEFVYLAAMLGSVDSDRIALPIGCIKKPHTKHVKVLDYKEIK